MLKKIRISLAVIFFTLITLLFLDFTGTLHAWFGWIAKIQFLPAILALNAGVVVMIVFLTLCFGRVYCSVLCPLGVFQDVMAWMGRRRRSSPYSFSPAKTWIRVSLLTLFMVAFILGIGAIISLLEPFSAYGRMANHLLLPVWQWGNNFLAWIAERMDSYAFYSTDVWIKGGSPAFLLAVITGIVVANLAWQNGRTYCNTICPVGTILGFLSRFSLFQVTIDEQKCVRCGICAQHCKASCIDSKESLIDRSRCVLCMNCLKKCREGAIKYKFAYAKPKIPIRKTYTKSDMGRKGFLMITILWVSSALKAQIIPKADILGKKSPLRQTPLTPAGSRSARNMKRRCTACQLCVTTCPNSVLRPSSSFDTFMQPQMSYERGYCRPECVKCSEVCPAGAIHKISKEEKSSTQIGHAVWVRERCIPLADGMECNNCERHCPTQAITMVPSMAGDEKSLKIPTVNEELCIGCGACEYLCPSRPLSAMYVEGHQVHRNI